MSHEESLTDEEFNTWPTAAEVAHSIPGDAHDRVRHKWVIERLRSGVFLAVARHANSTKSNKLREFIQIPVNLWEACADEGTTALWQTNDVSITDWSTGGYGAVNTVYRFHGVRIEPNDAMPKVLPNADSPPTRDKNTGGRPPKPFWDDMWAAICASIYHNELMPTKQVEIESAMSDWIVANGHEAGTTQIRDKARKLFNLIK